MTLILNIGLDIKATPSLSAHVAREMLVANGLLIKSSFLADSDTERTLVASVIPGPFLTNPARLRAALHQTAADLQQDRIAWWLPSAAHGELVGPNTAAWGAFSPEFFIDMDGQRLKVAA